MVMAPTPQALQGFRAVVVTLMGVSVALALLLLFGVHQRKVLFMLKIFPYWPDTSRRVSIPAVAAISEMGFLFVA